MSLHCPHLQRIKIALESVAACFISRSFFDNVIGLEKIVHSRTEALDSKNRDMRLLLDNVQQGFLTIDLAGALAQERSAAVDAWFGAPEPRGARSELEHQEHPARGDDHAFQLSSLCTARPRPSSAECNRQLSSLHDH
jgi:hypothetical protein